MVVRRLLINGDLHEAFDNIASLDVWKFVKNRDSMLEILKERKKKEETLRTYLFTSPSSYDSQRVDQLANCFDLSSTRVHSIVSKSVMNDSLHASQDQLSGCIVFENVKQSRVQALVFELTEKLSILAETNGRATKAQQTRGYSHILFFFSFLSRLLRTSLTVYLF